MPSSGTFLRGQHGGSVHAGERLSVQAQHSDRLDRHEPAAQDSAVQRGESACLVSPFSISAAGAPGKAC